MNKMSFIQSMRAYNLEYKLEKISIKSYRWLWTANWFFNGEPPKLPTKKQDKI